jgi:alanyl-tRNA synthetase
VLGERPEDTEELIASLNQQIQQDIQNDLAITTEIVSLDELKKRCTYIPPALPEDKPLRVVAIQNYFPIPCGGTHVNSTSELAGLVVHKMKIKKGQLKVSYAIGE